MTRPRLPRPSSIAVSGQGPLHQLLGSDSYALATGSVDALKNDIEAGQELTRTTDIPA